MIYYLVKLTNNINKKLRKFWDLMFKMIGILNMSWFSALLFIATLIVLGLYIYRIVIGIR